MSSFARKSRYITRGEEKMTKTIVLIYVSRGFLIFVWCARSGYWGRLHRPRFCLKRRRRARCV